MENLSLIGTAVFLNLLAAMSPGPDFIMAVKNSLCYSRRTGIYISIGIGLGIGIHITYCAIGIGYIISKSIIAFNIIKFLGAAYLVYMGINSVISKGSKIELFEEKKSADMTRLRAIKTGFLTNVLNPKATLFFLGLFTFVVKATTPGYIIFVMALLMIATAMGWFTLVAIFFTQSHIRNTFLKFEKIFNKIFGGLLIVLGIKIALTSR
jgi:RhtB (resistance to homoserine/threonine) family protein